MMSGATRVFRNCVSTRVPGADQIATDEHRATILKQCEPVAEMALAAQKSTASVFVDSVQS